MTQHFDALLIVSFGGPEGPDDVAPFLTNVTSGRNIPTERLEIVAQQYAAYGGVSPINGANRRLIEEIDRQLTVRDRSLPIYWGNRNWHPFLADAIQQMADDGVERAAAFITSAYSSYSGCRQYLEDLAQASAAAEGPPPEFTKLRQYFDHPGFIEPMVDNVDSALDVASGSHAAEHHVVFTAHSLPLTMAETCDYEQQLRATAGLIMDRISKPERVAATSHAWQSRSGSPLQKWLEPDIADHLGALAADGAESVVVVPIGFVSDHMEVMHDLDFLARASAEQHGLRFTRASTVGADPRFAAMVLDLMDEHELGTPALSLSSLGVRPSPCERGCCPGATRPAL
jgi:ferrochelatase